MERVNDLYLPRPPLEAESKRELLSLARALPKADIHVHFEGLVSKSIYLHLALKQGRVPMQGIFDEAFHSLSDFIEAIRFSNEVVRTDRHCELVVKAYARLAAAINIRHVELAVEPSFHSMRGLGTAQLFKGIKRGLDWAERNFGITYRLILSLALDLPPDEARHRLDEVEDAGIEIGAVGLAGNAGIQALSTFSGLLKHAWHSGYRVIAHAGETGPADEIWETIREFPISRIDHGCSAMHDPRLIDVLRESQLPLAMAPVSNHVSGASRNGYAAAKLLRRGLCVSLNSDDPGIQGSNLLSDFEMLIDHQNLSLDEIIKLVKNGIEASFLDRFEKDNLLCNVDNIVLNLNYI